jgi:hypothetical protein
MELDIFVNYIKEANTYRILIKLKKDIDLMTLQKYLCKKNK